MSMNLQRRDALVQALVGHNRITYQTSAEYKAWIDAMTEHLISLSDLMAEAGVERIAQHRRLVYEEEERRDLLHPFLPSAQVPSADQGEWVETAMGPKRREDVEAFKRSIEKLTMGPGRKVENPTLNLAAREGAEEGRGEPTHRRQGMSVNHKLTYGGAFTDLGPVAPDERDASCVAKWPECESGDFDPRCCRFPKACSPVPYTVQDMEADGDQG